MTEYIAYVCDRSWKLCETLEEANNWVTSLSAPGFSGGRVFVDHAELVQSQNKLAEAEESRDSARRLQIKYLDRSAALRRQLSAVEAAVEREHASSDEEISRLQDVVRDRERRSVVADALLREELEYPWAEVPVGWADRARVACGMGQQKSRVQELEARLASASILLNQAGAAFQHGVTVTSAWHECVRELLNGR